MLLFQDTRKNMFWRIAQDQLINQVLRKKQPHDQAFFPADLCYFLLRGSQSTLTPWVANNAMRAFVEYVINKGAFQKKPRPTLVQSLPAPSVLVDSEMLWGGDQGSRSGVSGSHAPFCSTPQLHLQVCWLSRMSPGRPLAKGTCRVSSPVIHTPSLWA